MTNYTRGRFVWHELMTPDVEGSKKFYAELFGWTFDERPMPGGMPGVYPTITKDNRPLGGVVSLEMLKKEGVPPHWMGYVSVANVDESAAATKANSGNVGVEPMDIPTVGRMSVIGDPQHAYSSALNLETGDPEPMERPGVGMFCWDQLNTTDVGGAAAFYQKVYVWTKEPFAPGSEMSVFKASGVPVASVMQAPEGVPAHWLTYVVVESLAAGRDKVVELGGKVMVEEIPVPEVGTIAVVQDQVGAMIGLFEAPAA
jgi:predicted enzyme related to lactoylglutathione lyase